jgi:toxin FitB
VGNSSGATTQGVDDENLFLSAVTLGEIQSGIELTRKQDPTKASEIEAWLDLVSSSYNVLPMEGEAFRTWARIMDKKSDALYEDAMIAATAMNYEFTVVTRNVSDFKAFKVPVLNPFTA